MIREHFLRQPPRLLLHAAVDASMTLVLDVPDLSLLEGGKVSANSALIDPHTPSRMLHGVLVCSCQCRAVGVRTPILQVDRLVRLVNCQRSILMTPAASGIVCWLHIACAGTCWVLCHCHSTFLDWNIN